MNSLKAIFGLRHIECLQEGDWIFSKRLGRRAQIKQVKCHQQIIHYDIVEFTDASVVNKRLSSDGLLRLGYLPGRKKM